MAGEGRKAVIAACIANAGIGVAKLVGFFLTGASSMLAEAVHSAADSGNQLLLLLGASRASRAPSAEHQFGYGRERYFWAFIVAVVIFSLGGLFAVYEGVHKLSDPQEIKSPLIAVGILGFGILLEGWSFYTAIKAAQKAKGQDSWREYLDDTKQAELPVVLLEDLGALIGLVVAMLGVTLSVVTGDARFDALGSIAIGILLGLIAVFLCIKMHSLIIGEAAETEHVDAIKLVIADEPDVSKLLHVRTTHLGPDHLLVGAKVEFSAGLSFVQVANAIDRMEQQIRSELPVRAMIYLEPALQASGSGEQPPPSG